MRKALKIVVLFGFVSLFADVTYEGARSVLPNYLGLLGASTVLVGLVLSLSELVGYGSRILFGYYADRTRRYWFLTFLGYVINLFSIPILGLVGRWDLVLLLILFERIGKGLRTPAREVLLSGTTREIPSGRVFGIHEALDQIGAVLGPLLATLVLYFTNENYSLTFLFFALPALASMFALSLTYVNYEERFLVLEKESGGEGVIDWRFWVYLFGMFFALLGLVYYATVLDISRREGVFPEWLIPSIYLLIMGVDAFVAIIAGLLYDKFGGVVNIGIPLAAALSSIFLVELNQINILIVSISLGAALGIFESVSRSYIADIVKMRKRGFGYGAFYTLTGTALVISSIIFGLLYQLKMLYLAPIYVIPLEFLASILIYLATRRAKS